MLIYRFTIFTSLIYGLCFSQILVCSPSLANETTGIVWSSLQTKHTIIYFQSLEHLEQFNRSIRYGPGPHGILFFFSHHGSEELHKEVSTKIDAMYERVQEILDMKKSLSRVKINLYGNSNQLHQAYSDLYGAECRIRAWYEYKNNTVYINVNDLHEGILAHELAHSIIDNYLIVHPPRATAEILARYVDLHLEE